VQLPDALARLSRRVTGTRTTVTRIPPPVLGGSPTLLRTTSRTSSIRSTPLRPGQVAAALLAAAALVLAGCNDTDPSAAEADATGDGVEAPAHLPDVRVEGRSIVLVDVAGETTLATVEDAELLHAALRPGARSDDAITVLALTRSDGAYELRYVTRTGDEVTDLYRFPSRMQVDPALADVLDVPPVPVWAPDGDSLAWLEWSAEGTRLRTVGWLDHEAGTNPSDDQATYRVDEVPAGAWIESWRTDASGGAILDLTDADGERWRLRVADDDATVIAA
jgi:hypothetical protein